MTNQDLLAETMAEVDLQANVVDMCRVFGLLVFHPFDSRRSTPGWPDLAIAGTRLLVRELKTATGKVTRAQQAWIDALAGAGVDVGVWRPAQWLDGTIARELAAIKPRGQ